MAFQGKMNFNQDRNKQTLEVFFSAKVNKINHPPLFYNQSLVKSCSTQKYLRMVLGTKLDFNLHLKKYKAM